MKKIAIIDDSELVLAATAEALKAAGYAAITMTEPRRDELAAADDLALVLVDVNLPEAFGDDVARFIREVWSIDVPIYLYSSLSEAELVERTRDAGADGYICKSWGIQPMIAAVDKILQGAAPDGAGQQQDEAQQSVFGRFAERCLERQERILALIDPQELASAGTSHGRLDPIGFELHDWIGESKLLGFDKISATADELNTVLRSWGGVVAPGTQSTQLRRWILELTEISRRRALEAPSPDLSRKLQALREELSAELGSGAAAPPRSKTPTSGAFPVLKPSRRILVFDDSPIVGEALALELGGKGHTVQLASSYAEFMRHLNTFKPEIIFIDINMPEIQGDEVCRRLRTRTETSNMPIIFLSSLPDDELAALAQRSGANGYLSKQRGMDDLTEYLDELMSEIIF